VSNLINELLPASLAESHSKILQLQRTIAKLETENTELKKLYEEKCSWVDDLKRQLEHFKESRNKWMKEVFVLSERLAVIESEKSNEQD
jgi:predicted RNase H-like nuclease (RuvC/YqgF family)